MKRLVTMSTVAAGHAHTLRERGTEGGGDDDVGGGGGGGVGGDDGVWV